MKSTKSLLHFLILTLALLSSCSKDNPVEPLQNEKQLLTKAWQLTKAYMLQTNGAPIDATSELSLIYLQFNSDGTYTSSFQNGKWEYDEPGKKIYFDKGTTAPFTADVKKITSDSLRIQMYLPNNGGYSLFELIFAVNKNLGSKAADVNFEALWKEFDQRYSFFEIKRINWDSLHTVYKAKIKSTTTEGELFQILSSLIAELKDGHADLTTPFGYYSYKDWWQKHPGNFLGEQATFKYLVKSYPTQANGNMKFGKLTNDIGYIYVGPNLNGDVTTWSNAIDLILDSLKNTKGIVVDIRNNGGGNDNLGMTIAGRFTDQTRIYSYVRYRNGSKHSDFTDYSERTITSQGKLKYLKHIAFLTNRRCFSSAEGTTLMFRSIPTVTVIGDTTGGGSANPITLQLPNGWSYRVARWIQYTADKKVFEGKGLAPNIPVWISKADSLGGKDAILERAIKFLDTGK